MFTSRFIKTSLTAFFLCSLTQAAFAATAWLAPSGDWTVGPIAAQSSNGGSYCSMKNNYPAGQSLVFARDNMGSNSIALDFHKDVFQAGNQYNVKAVAGSVTRNLDALAATAQVLVIQTGIDTVFYGDIAHRHKVTFTVKKSSYSYELDVSAADALAALGHCADSFGNGAAFAEATFPLGTVHKESLKQIEAESDEASVAATAEGADLDEQAAPAPVPAPEKHHKKTAKKSAPQAEEAPKEQLTVEVTEPTSPRAQADTVRDDMKAEIAEELLNLHSAPKTAAANSFTSSSAPLAAVDKSPLAGAAPVIPPRVEGLDLKNLLLSSHVVSAQQIKTGNNGAFRWASGGLFGSAQQLPLAQGKSLTDKANDYLRKTAALCKGDFAQRLGHLRTAGKLDILEADITCLDGQNNAAAAVLFVGDRGTFSIIAEEGTIDQLHTAMENRDALISAATHVSKASNDIRIMHGYDPPPDRQLAQDTLPQDTTGPPLRLAAAQKPLSPPPSLPTSYAPPSPAAPLPQNTAPKQTGLAVQTGLTIGADASRYKYREETPTSSPFMNQSGYKGGVDVAYTALPFASWPYWYLSGEGRYAAGSVNYSSASGSASQNDNLWEIRGLIGRDFIISDYTALSPYTGYGFRYLYNDMRGTTSLGANGYRRQSTYQYIPLGITDRLKLTDESRIATTFEYDAFTEGTEKSYLSDANPVFPNIVSHQHHGYGTRGSVLFEKDGWSAGPWFNFWHVGDSEYFLGDEPDNRTTEVGFKITKQVW